MSSNTQRNQTTISDVITELIYDMDNGNNICVVDSFSGEIMNVGPQKAVTFHSGVEIIKAIHDLNNPELRKIFFRINHKQNHFYDSYITFNLSHNSDTKDLPMSNNSVIAGGRAVVELLKYIESPIQPWKDTDVDVFMLGQHQFRNLPMTIGGKKIDVVLTPERTPSHLLHRFDIACCRAAIHDISDLHFSLTVSVKCLQSLFTRKVSVPSYIKNTAKCQDLKDFKLAVKTATASLKRIKKYEKRGFIFVQHDIMRPLPFITKRYFKRAGFLIDTRIVDGKPMLIDRPITSDPNLDADVVSGYYS